MERLCERPGCSDPASVAYGMRPEDLVFWLDALRSGPNEHGVLCRRHADTMVVPRGWTLDDLRDPDLHLFRPPSDDSGSIRRPRARRTTHAGEHEQLALGVEPEPAVAAQPQPDTAVDDEGESTPTVNTADVDAASPGDTATDAAAGAGTDTAPDAATDTGADASADTAEPWMPMFDTSDDLDGLLAARSPLLSRAFRGERNG